MVDNFTELHKVVFYGAALALFLLERVPALRLATNQTSGRWTTNIGLFVVNSLIAGTVIQISVYHLALDQPAGVMARLGVPLSAQVVLTFLFLDCWTYWQHRVLHRLPWLWRLHLVHHSDTHLDVTTTERHHPFEAILGAVILIALVLALGLPALGLGLYVLVVGAVSIASHANLRLSPQLDRALRWLVVTPAFHAVHHSRLQAETDSNYSNVLTIWDRLFGSYSDPDVAQIPAVGLEYFRQPRDTEFWRVLGQPFLYRRAMTFAAHPIRELISGSSGQARAPTTSPAKWPSQWRNSLILGVTGCLLAGLVLWPTALEMATVWNSASYQFAWLIVPMIVYLTLWHAPQEIQNLAPRPGYTGVFVAVLAAIGWSAFNVIDINVGRQFALVLALQGIILSALGRRVYWQLLPMFAFTFLMVPSGDLLLPVLRVLTVRSIELFAVVTGLPHTVDGFGVVIGKAKYIVISECAGLPYFMLGTFLGYSFGLLLYRSVIKVLALALVGAAVGIVSNFLRVNAIIWIDWVQGSQMPLTAHGNVQWVALLLSLGVMFYVLSKLDADVVSADPDKFVGKRTTLTSQFSPVLAGLSILLIAGGASWLISNPTSEQRDLQLASFPQALGGWELSSSSAAWSINRQDQTQTLDLTYRRDGKVLQVRVVEALVPEAKLVESDLAPGKRSEWAANGVMKQSGCVANNCLTLSHTTWQNRKTRMLRHVYSSYFVGSDVTDSKLAFRIARGWDRLNGGHGRPRMVGMSLDSAVDASGLDELVAGFRHMQYWSDPNS